jgi:hypothetical protein
MHFFSLLIIFMCYGVLIEIKGVKQMDKEFNILRNIMLMTVFEVVALFMCLGALCAILFTWGA